MLSTIAFVHYRLRMPSRVTTQLTNKHGETRDNNLNKRTGEVLRDIFFYIVIV